MKIGFRLDANSIIGLGHYFRCNSLINLFKNNHSITIFNNINSINFFQNQKIVKIKHSSLKNKIQFEINFWKNYLSKNQLDLLLIDNYELTKSISFLTFLNKNNIKIMVLDDFKSKIIYCHIYYNPSIRKKDIRKCNILNETTYILGAENSICNSKSSHKYYIKNKVKRVLIFLTNSKKKYYINKMIGYLKRLSLSFNEIEFHFIIGKFNTLDNATISNKNLKYTQFLKNFDYELSRSDLLISSGGSINWQKIALGIPSIIFELSNNQSEICNQMKKLRTCSYMGTLKDINYKKFYLNFSNMLKYGNRKNQYDQCMKYSNKNSNKNILRNIEKLFSKN